MRSKSRSRRAAVAAVLALALMVPLALTGSGAAAQEAPAPSATCTVAPVTVRGANLCTPIVFADSASGDLWVTDEYGAGPVRLTNTPMIEGNPSSMGYWIAYDGSSHGGPRDIYMMSIVGGSRIKITGNRADDFDPTLGLPFDLYTGFGMPIVYSSDRAEGKQGGKCGIELFGELYGVQPPSRMIGCDHHDKVDAELAIDNQSVAYTAVTGQGFGVWAADVNGQAKVVGGSQANMAMFPTWAYGFNTGAPQTGTRSPRAAAGNWPITYSKLSQGDAGSLYSINRDGSGDASFLAPPNNQSALMDAEWDLYGQRIVFATQQGTVSRIGWANGDGSLGDWGVTPKRFYVTGVDWVNINPCVPPAPVTGTAMPVPAAC